MQEEPAEQLVLPPESARTVEALLRLGEPIAAEMHLSAQIDRDRIVVSAGPAERPALKVTLVHESAAPRGARKANGLALVEEPGPAPRELVEGVLRRMERAAVKLEWRRALKPTDTEPRQPEAPSSRPTPLRFTLFFLPAAVLTGVYFAGRGGDAEGTS